MILDISSRKFLKYIYFLPQCSYMYHKMLTDVKQKNSHWILKRPTCKLLMYQSQLCDVRKPSYMHICQHCASCIWFRSEHADLKIHYSRDIELCMNTLLSEINPHIKLTPPIFDYVVKMCFLIEIKGLGEMKQLLNSYLLN